MTKADSITLAKLISSLPAGSAEINAAQIKRAYGYAEQYHQGRPRPSGELCIEFNLAVAFIICDLELDTPTILAALLQDTLHDDDRARDAEIRKLFGVEVTNLILGLRNLNNFAAADRYKQQTQQSDSAQLEQIRRAILSIIEGDIRVVMLRMAQALQQLRKASSLPRPAQLEVANEAMNVYAPLANRLGIWQLKWQIEDLAFRYLEPDVYKEIARRIDEKRGTRLNKVETAVKQLQSKIDELGLKAAVTGRPKHIYSIYRKIERKGVDLDQIYDVHALRVVIDTRETENDSRKPRKQKDDEARTLCYQVLGAVHSLWQPIPHEFDDYIASPKPNGYRSLHTAVMDDKGQTLEVQIRTDKMDEEAERGIAAHWAYKEGSSAKSSSNLNKRIHWFRQLLSNLQDANDTLTDHELLQQELLGERIYVFTPRGDVVDLPAGATPIDFAYHIHTEVGHRCRGAKVNGKMASLDYQLQSGDKLEIITASRGGPSRDWMNESLGYTGSARTRSRIRQWFRQQEREKNIQHGREVVERELKRLGLADTFTVADIAASLRHDDVDQFLAKVGFGDIQSTQIGGAIASLQQKLKPDDELLPLLIPQSKSSKGLTVRGMAGLVTRFAGCCNPIPPQPIIGYITRGSGVTIHQANCSTLNLIDEKERLIEVEWGAGEETYPIPIVIRAYHRPGLVEDIATVLKGRKISVPKTKKSTANSITTLYMIAEVADLAELDWLLQRFEKLPNVLEVRRERWSD